MGNAAGFFTAIKALRQLGIERVAENMRYRLGLLLDVYPHFPPVTGPAGRLSYENLPTLLDGAPGWNEQSILAEAREICGGQVRLFGGALVPLRLSLQGPLRPWRDYELGRAEWGAEDVKFIWEPARFGWAVCLARAYRISGDEVFPRCFWHYFQEFIEFNPAYTGPNWTSGQEAALRIVTWAFVVRALMHSPESTPERLSIFSQAMAVHAARIPPTLIYARSQDNNHLLSEAAGLYTAGALLAEHPSARKWRELGWGWFNRAIQQQIEPDGTYIQQSVNYHRLALQLALWVDGIARKSGRTWPAVSQERLAAAALWLHAHVDPVSGEAPNLGHNDGAYLFAFGKFADQRGVVQAACRAFTGRAVLEAGDWDEFSGWLGLRNDRPGPAVGSGIIDLIDDRGDCFVRTEQAWGMLRTAQYRHRPGQADQLHADLWHQGVNITLDAGTYRYNAAQPWQNSLSNALVHNSVTIDDHEPMTRAGRFLWLDWDQAVVIERTPERVKAEHSGYRKLGVVHRRSMEWLASNQWQITDDILAAGESWGAHEMILHWLFPDWEWRMKGLNLQMDAPGGSLSVVVQLKTQEDVQSEIQLVRAGKLVYGSGPTAPILGWYSPTYNSKAPALALRVKVSSGLPVQFITRIRP